MNFVTQKNFLTNFYHWSSISKAFPLLTTQQCFGAWRRKCNKPLHQPMITSFHYNDVTMRAMASQITSLTIVYSTVYSGADKTKYQSSASLACARGIHRWPVNSLHKGPVTRKMFPFDDVIMVHVSSYALVFHSVLSIWAGSHLYLLLVYVCVCVRVCVHRLLVVLNADSWR